MTGTVGVSEPCVYVFAGGMPCHAPLSHEIHHGAWPKGWEPNHPYIAPGPKPLTREDSIRAEAAAAARAALLDELEAWARDGKQPMWRTARLAVLEWVNRRRP